MSHAFSHEYHPHHTSSAMPSILQQMRTNLFNARVQSWPPLLALVCSSFFFAGDKEPAADWLNLRNDTALNYLSPEPHLRLARFHYEKGEKAQAFFIAEHTREMFGDEKFTPAFHKLAAVRLKSSEDFEDEEDLTQFCKTHPESVEARVLDLEDELAGSKKQVARAEQRLESLLVEHPEYMLPKAVAARYFLKAKGDEDRAFQVYIDLYFHDPHYYDWEYAEFRIKEISSKRKQSWWKDRKKTKLSCSELAAAETNPRVLDVMMDELSEHWTPAAVSCMLRLLNNDDNYVQARALRLLMDHSEDFSKDEIVVPMLKSHDLVKRAMAAFLVVKCFETSQYGLLQDNLDSGIDLVQLDAIEALSKIGGKAGVEYLKAHRPTIRSKEMSDFVNSQLTQDGSNEKPSLEDHE